MKIKFLNLSKFIIKLNTQLLSFYKIYFKLIYRIKLEKLKNFLIKIFVLNFF